MHAQQKDLPSLILPTGRTRRRVRSGTRTRGSRRANRASTVADTGIGTAGAAVVIVPCRDEGLIGRITVAADTARGLEGVEEARLAEAGEPGGLRGAGGTTILGGDEGGTRKTTCWE